MSKAKIIIYDVDCELEEYRNDFYELAVELPESTNVALAKKQSETSDLDKLVSDYSISFDITPTKLESEIIGNIERLTLNNGKLVFRCILEVDGYVALDGFMYVNSTKEKGFDPFLTYNVQIIGTHQTWKQYLKSIRLPNLTFPEVTWNTTELFADLAINNQYYTSGGPAIYPLIANFGKRWGGTSLNLYDIRYLVYDLAIIEQAFYMAGYKIESSFLYGPDFRNQASYLLDIDFGINENIDLGTEILVSLQNNSDTYGVYGTLYPIPFDIETKDPFNRYNNAIANEFQNNSGRNLYDVKIDVDMNFYNYSANSAGTVLYAEIYDASGVLKGNFVIPESVRNDGVIFPTVPVSTLMASGETFSLTATFDLSLYLRENLINDGFLEPGWRILLAHGQSDTTAANSVRVNADAQYRIYTQTKTHFEEGDVFDPAKPLLDSFTVYDWLLELKTIYGLKFKTDQAQKIVYIEPEQPVYNSYATLSESSQIKRGFFLPIQSPEDNNVINLTGKIDSCEFIKKSFPSQAYNKYFKFLFADSSDQAPIYEQYDSEANPAFGNDLSRGQPNQNVEEIQLKIYQPVLNDYDNDIGSQGSPRFPIYLPYMWENKQDEDSTQLPNPGTNLGARRFVVYGTYSQTYKLGNILVANGVLYEGGQLAEVTNVGQVFEQQLAYGGSLFEIPTQNNVFFDNKSAIPTGKNIVNTYQVYGVAQSQTDATVKVRVNMSIKEFLEFDPRKLVKIFLEQSNMMRFNGYYQWISVSKDLKDSSKAILTLKPMRNCNG